jgi:hypothetical protein
VSPSAPAARWERDYAFRSLRTRLKPRRPGSPASQPGRASMGGCAGRSAMSSLSLDGLSSARARTRTRDWQAHCRRFRHPRRGRLCIDAKNCENMAAHALIHMLAGTASIRRRRMQKRSVSGQSKACRLPFVQTARAMKHSLTGATATWPAAATPREGVSQEAVRARLLNGVRGAPRQRQLTRHAPPSSPRRTPS